MTTREENQATVNKLVEEGVLIPLGSSSASAYIVGPYEHDWVPHRSDIYKGVLVVHDQCSHYFCPGDRARNRYLDPFTFQEVERPSDD